MRCFLAASIVLLPACVSNRGGAESAGVTSAAVAVPGGVLHCEAAGSGSPLVFVHGGFGDRRMWDEQFATFARDHRVVRYDLRGFGKSSPADQPYSPVADLLAVLDQARFARAHLVGNSMGGTLVIDFALLHPDRIASLTIVASGANGFPATDAQRKRHQRDLDGMREVFRRAASEGDERGIELWCNHPMVAVTSTDADTSPKLRAMVRDNCAIFHMQHWPVESLQPPAIERLTEVRAPTLVVVGDRDIGMVRDNADVTARGIPGAQRVVIIGADHLPQMTEPQQFDRVLREFLARHRP